MYIQFILHVYRVRVLLFLHHSNFMIMRRCTLYALREQAYSNILKILPPKK